MKWLAALVSCMLLSAPVLASEITPAERRDHSFNAAIPGCGDPLVLGDITSRFAERESRVLEFRPQDRRLREHPRDRLAALGPGATSAPLLLRHRAGVGRIQAPGRILGPRRPRLPRHRLGHRLVRRPASIATTPTRPSASRRRLESPAWLAAGVPVPGAFELSAPTRQPMRDTRGAPAGTFDFYVLALSWSPGFCETSSTARSDKQCANGSGLGFVTHGLWPQSEVGLSKLLRTVRPVRPARRRSTNSATCFPTRTSRVTNGASTAPARAKARADISARSSRPASACRFPIGSRRCRPVAGHADRDRARLRGGQSGIAARDDGDLLRPAGVPGNSHLHGSRPARFQAMPRSRSRRLPRGRDRRPGGSMNYRHAFHAGNFADVMKHALLVRIIAYLQRKETPIRVIDTHAGLGLYDLAGDAAGRTGEWIAGIGRLEEAFAPEVEELLAPYRTIVAEFGRATARRSIRARRASCARSCGGRTGRARRTPSRRPQGAQPRIQSGDQPQGAASRRMDRAATR